jgi:hypothetical protein
MLNGKFTVLGSRSREQHMNRERSMALIWLTLALLALLVVDLAAVLFAVDTRPGLEHSPRPWARPGRP